MDWSSIFEFFDFFWIYWFFLVGGDFNPRVSQMVVGNFLPAGEWVSNTGEESPVGFKSTCFSLPSIQRSPKWLGKFLSRLFVQNHTVPQLIGSDFKSVAMSCAGVGGVRDRVLDDTMTSGSHKFHCAWVGWAERTKVKPGYNDQLLYLNMDF